MRKLLIILISVILIISCTSTKVEYMKPEMPTFSIVRPLRPILEEVNTDIPIEAQRNTAKLISYVNQLEAYSEGWETYYLKIQEIMNVK